MTRCSTVISSSPPAAGVRLAQLALLACAQELASCLEKLLSVIPANAGIHFSFHSTIKMDPGIRRDDGEEAQRRCLGRAVQ